MPRETSYLQIGNLKGKHDAGLLKKKLDELPGILSVSLNSSMSQLAVDYDDTGVKQEGIVNRLKELGYEVVADNVQDR